MPSPRYSVVLVDQAGGSREQLVRAQVESLNWELNGWGEARWTMDVGDPQIERQRVLAEVASIDPPKEVQIWRDGRLMWWGIPNGVPSCDGHTVTFTAYGLLWYFAKRFFGPVYSNTIPSLLRNGDFEGDPLTTNVAYAGWAITGATASGTTARRKFGQRALRLETFGNPDQYAINLFQMPTPARSRPLEVTASCWVYVESIVTPNDWDLGLILVVFNDQLNKRAEALITNDTPRNEWVRLEVKLELAAADTTQDLAVILHCPDQGVTIWDGVRCTHQQRTGALEGQDWGDDFIRRVFNYGAGNSFGGSEGPGGAVGSQDQWWGAKFKKSNLGMTFLGSTLATESLRADVYWDHEDHGSIYEAMLEPVKRGILDFEIVWNNVGSVRQLATYPGGKGKHRRMVVELGRDISGLTYTVDGRRTANDVRVVGRNSGDTKEVGQAGGPRPYTLGSLQLEAVTRAPDEVEGQGLADTALWEERKLRRPVPMPTIRVPAEPYLDPNQPGGPLVVGDTVVSRVKHGWLQDTSERRVVAMTLHPETEELDLVVNIP